MIMDTEYTVWEGSFERGWGGPNEHKEIVAIGSIKVDGPMLTETDSQVIFVRPEKNPKLSDFFINFTHITQEMVDKNGVSLREALNKFSNWCDFLPIFSFGPDDKIMRANCDLISISFPFPDNMFHDVRDVFEAQGVAMRKYTSGTILEALGEKGGRSAHNPLNDVRTILDGLRILSGRISSSKES